MMSLKCIHWYPYKKKTDTQKHKEKKACDNRDRDQSDTAVFQGITKDFPEPPEATRESWNRYSLSASRRNHPGDNLISDFWPPEQ